MSDCNGFIQINDLERDLSKIPNRTVLLLPFSKCRSLSIPLQSIYNELYGDYLQSFKSRDFHPFRKGFARSTYQ